MSVIAEIGIGDRVIVPSISVHVEAISAVLRGTIAIAAAISVSRTRRENESRPVGIQRISWNPTLLETSGVLAGTAGKSNCISRFKVKCYYIGLQ